MSEQERPEVKIYEEMMKDVSLPRFADIVFDQKTPSVDDVEECLLKEFASTGVLASVKPGASVALTVGSREIDRIALIVRTVANEIKKAGGKPFIVPAMGSHGGADAASQQKLIENFGVTEEYTGVPIVSSLDTVSVGTTEDGLDVRIDKNAAGADGIVVIGRVKTHTSFRGKVESGLMKMMAIGLGKPYGAAICHQLGFTEMSKNVWNFGNVILQNANVLFGIAIIENGDHRTARIEAMKAGEIPEREPGLLAESKGLMNKIPFENLDLLIIEEMGKEFSGTGMDTNITGRSTSLGVSQPAPKRIAVFDLTDHSEGNATGMHEADVITERFEKKVNRRAVYINGITAREIEGLRMPAVMPNESLALRLCIMNMLPKKEPEKIRAVWIKNTLRLENFRISEGLLEEASRNEKIDIVGPSREIDFDPEGNICRKI